MPCYSMHYLGSFRCNLTYCPFISMSTTCNSINYPFTPFNWMYYQTLQWFQSIELNVLVVTPMHSHNIIISLSNIDRYLYILPLSFPMVLCHIIWCTTLSSSDVMQYNPMCFSLFQEFHVMFFQMITYHIIRFITFCNNGFM